MAFEACTEGFIRFFFIIARSFIDHWGLALTVVGLAALLLTTLNKMGGWGVVIFGLLADGADYITDAAELTGLGAIPSAVVGGIILSILWLALLLFSKTNAILKVLGFPIFLILGALVGALPDFLPLTTGYAFLLKNELSANISVGVLVLATIFSVFISFAPLFAVIGGLTFFGFFDICTHINTVSQLLI